MWFNAFTLCHFNPAGLVTLEKAPFADVVIPEDIGHLQAQDGFLPVVDDRFVVRFDTGALLRPARASKPLTKPAIDRKLGELAAAGHVFMDAAAALEVAKMHLLEEAAQGVSPYPLVLDGRTGVAIFGTSSPNQTRSVFNLLQAIAPELELALVNAGNVPDHMSAWLEESVDLPAGLSLGRMAELKDLHGKSRTVVRDQPLDVPDVINQIRLHRRSVVRLALRWMDSFDLVLNDPLAVTSIRLTQTGAAAIPLDYDSDMALSEAAELGECWRELFGPLASLLATGFRNPARACVAANDLSVSHGLFA